jgi:hypothetical protein
MSGPSSVGELAAATGVLSECGQAGGGDRRPLLRAGAPFNSDHGRAVLLHERGRRCEGAVGARNKMSGLDRAARRVQDKVHLTYDGQK